MKTYHHLTEYPIKNHKIAKECEEMLIGTPQKRERWEKICEKLQGKPTEIVETTKLKPFVIHLN